LPYLDYVALDVKTSPQKYPSLGAKDTTELVRTIEILKMGKIDYEFRTTVVPGFVDAQDIHAISELVKGAETWALQQFVPGDTLDKRLDMVKPFPPETLDKYADMLRSYAERIVVRT
jgi:pyruvate formate lyase activating enzyme